MKNLGTILMLLAASATYVAAVPTRDHVARSPHDEALEIYAREPKKGVQSNATDVRCVAI